MTEMKNHNYVKCVFSPLKMKNKKHNWKNKFVDQFNDYEKTLLEKYGKKQLINFFVEWKFSNNKKN